MKAAARNSQISDSDLAVPAQLVLVAALLGAAIAAVLIDAGRTTAAFMFLGLSVIFAVVARARKGRYGK